jgi:hypothetical protein
MAGGHATRSLRGLEAADDIGVLVRDSSAAE